MNECKKPKGGSGGESGPCSPEADLDPGTGTNFDDTSNEALVVDVESPTGSTTPGPYNTHNFLSPPPGRHTRAPSTKHTHTHAFFSPPAAQDYVEIRTVFSSLFLSAFCLFLRSGPVRRRGWGRFGRRLKW